MTKLYLCTRIEVLRVLLHLIVSVGTMFSVLGAQPRRMDTVQHSRNKQLVLDHGFR